jgi:beta-glucosidase-like glycosyl hydrolase
MEEKVGQLLTVCFFDMDRKSLDRNLRLINQYHLGGIFHGWQNVDNFAECVDKIQRNVKVPLLVAADYEMGVGQTVDGGTKFPKPMCRGAHGDPKNEYIIGEITAKEGRAIGTNCTASPVLDVNTDPLCPDVNVRAYSDDPEVVCKMSIPLIKGLQENGMIAMGKHFPGNGGTYMDQHICTAIVDHSKEEMHKIWLEPYKRAFKEANLMSIMVAHLEVPALVTERNQRNGRIIPASLSKEILQDLLRKELGFTGMVMSDALNMGGVTTHFPREEVAVRCIKAGVDTLLIFTPETFQEDYNAILHAVRKGEISEDRINDAVRHILSAKAKIKLDETRGLPEPKEKRKEIFKKDLHAEFCRKIVAEGLTLLSNNEKTLPIRDLKGKKVVVLDVFSPDRQTLLKQGQQPTPAVVADLLRRRGARVDRYEIAPELSLDQLRGEILGSFKAKGYDYIFIDFFAIPNWGIGTLIPNKNAVRLFMFGILTLGIPVIVTAFGDPYVRQFCPAAPTFLCAFDDTVAAQEAAVQAWLGEVPVTGKMPVALRHIFERGDGLKL